MTYRIPFNKPFIIGKELYYVAQSVLQGQISGDGPYTKKVQRYLEETFHSRQVLLTNSCTAALELAAILSDVKPDDEVILPSFTFSSTANAFLLRRARLVFVDVRPDTLNLDERILESAITHRTRAIVPVHYAGTACDMDSILGVARKYGLMVVEDAAQGVNSKYKGKYLGTLGDLGAYSFHETKNFICGEGGAIVLNNADFVQRAEIIREKGTNRSRFFRGEVDKYTWVDIGSSLLPSDILAAFLFAQLENMELITMKRERIYRLYEGQLRGLAHEGLLSLPSIPPDCESNYHMFFVVLNSLKTRTDLIEHLKSQGILAVFHYVPLHTSPMGRSMGYREGMLPVTESVSERVLRLPMYYDMQDHEVMSVVAEIFRFFKMKAPRLDATDLQPTTLGQQGFA
jgi:dTDP-4-amino-4,6-dideoxygalactose transaminase